MVYEMNHMNCGYEIKWSYDLRSYERNFHNCVEKPEKFRTSTGFEPVTSRFRCDALTNWAMKPLTLGAGHLWVLIVPWGMNQWLNGIWNESYELRIWNQVKLWSSQLWTQFLQLRREAWKIQDFNGVWTRDLAIPVRRSNQLSYEATDVESWSFVVICGWSISHLFASLTREILLLPRVSEANEWDIDQPQMTTNDQLSTSVAS